MVYRKRHLLCAIAGLLSLSLLLAGCLFGNRPLAEFVADPWHGFPPIDITFDARMSGSDTGSITAYAWDFGDGESDYGPVVTHTFWEKGIYEVTLTVTEASGQQDAITYRVQALNRIPHPEFSYSPYMVGKGQPIRLDASDSYDDDGEIVAWYWDFGDGTVGEGEYVEHIYESANGNGWKPQIVLTVVDDDGDENSTVRQVQVVGCDSCG